MVSDELADVIKETVIVLRTANIPYMLVGSNASSYYGPPRTTQDIDFVIAPTPAALDILVKQYDHEKFSINRETAFQALRSCSLFNVIDIERGWKIDFIICKPDPFYIEEFNRRREIALFGTMVFIASVEDVIISKLQWAKMSESDRQILDVSAILRVQKNALDLSYVENWVSNLGLNLEWQKAQKIAGD